MERPRLFSGLGRHRTSCPRPENRPTFSRLPSGKTFNPASNPKAPKKLKPVNISPPSPCGLNFFRTAKQGSFAGRTKTQPTEKELRPSLPTVETKKTEPPVRSHHPRRKSISGFSPMIKGIISAERKVRAKSLEKASPSFVLLQSWRSFLQDFNSKISGSLELYDSYKAYADFIQEIDFQTLLDLVESRKMREKFKFSIFLERFLFSTVFLLELSGQFRKESLFLQKSAQICLLNFNFFASIFDEGSSLQFPVRGKIESFSVEENNKKLYAVLSQLVEAQRNIFFFLAKTKELIQELSIEELTFGMLEVFGEEFGRRGVLGNKASSNFTLVLDLDETLVHYENADGNDRVIFRPFLSEFLEEVSQNFCLAVFTSSLKEYADLIIDLIDPEGKYLSRRFYRSDMVCEGEEFFKDLALLGFDLKKTIIIDNSERYFQRQKSNGILIHSFLGCPQDTSLRDLLPLFRAVAKQAPEDVRLFLDEHKMKLVESVLRGSVTPVGIYLQAS